MHMTKWLSMFIYIEHKTQWHRGYIFCPGSFGYCQPRFIPTYIFMFWNRNWVFKLTTIDVPSGLQTRNFQSSVIHHHEFSLIGKFNVYICETLSPTTVAAVGVIWILAGNWLTMVTSISRHVLLSWHRPHTKKVKSFCNYVMPIDVNQFGSFICYCY